MERTRCGELTSLGIAEVLILASGRGSEVQGLLILLSHLHPQSLDRKLVDWLYNQVGSRV